MSKFLSCLLDFLLPLILLAILHPSFDYSSYLGAFYYYLILIQLMTMMILSSLLSRFVLPLMPSNFFAKLKIIVLSFGVIVTYVFIEVFHPVARWHEKIASIDNLTALLNCESQIELRKDFQAAKRLANEISNVKMIEYTESKNSAVSLISEIECSL